jgi:hypothetical protein
MLQHLMTLCLLSEQLVTLSLMYLVRGRGNVALAIGFIDMHMLHPDTALTCFILKINLGDNCKCKIHSFDVIVQN